MKRSFCFIFTPLDVEGSLPFEVIPNHFFERADKEQVKLIKEKLPTDLEPFHVPQYEFTWLRPTDNTQWKREPLAEATWRYWVINFTGINREIGDLTFAASLLKGEIELGFTFLFMESGGAGFSWNGDFQSTFFRSLRLATANVIKIDTTILIEMADNYAALKSAAGTQSQVYKAVNRYHYLKALPRESSMLVIGYFSIIETLIAHKPRLQESLDSINHQLQSKLILLSKRFQRRLDYSAHFGQMKEERIWKRLYAFRSATAHDMLIDFETEFKDLKGRDNILSFLSEVVKLLLLFGLKEPVFLADLKNC